MDPFILTKFIKPDSMKDVDPIVSLVVFEWSDKDLIGVPLEGGEMGEVGDLNIAETVRVRLG